MEVTHAEIGQVIEQIFTSQALVEDDFVGFGLDNDTFKAEVVMQVFDLPKSMGDDTGRQGMQIWVWFTHADENRMNLSKFDFGEVLELCHKLNDGLNWGSLTPRQVDDHTIEIGLHRTIDISSDDIRQGLDSDLDSELLRALVRMCEEWETLSPVLSGISTGQIQSLDGIELLLEDFDTKQ